MTESQLAAIYSTYPLAESILRIVNAFKSWGKQKNVDGLSSWMNRASTFTLPEIDAFVNGIKLDISAVMNALTTRFSNGLVEGCINKINVIKRIMYGRCHFALLKSKCILLCEFN